ncbi:DUF962 domain-containing protein [Enterovibrio nigricans]|uniref:Uncharacterized membrane protein YGL010W n=1 Tax=Enterovibrio nigricans DSM 22720 TaxID=1121868 RepID=A0A1T4V0P6_9GAMM|nr:Mpo1-like protein [Enterovibrio nigricans]PKF49798.1 DUF962 domain-containing protein [Enterovibrio nigricans]SKA58476.1 Uncharacterized membrane protein YGL010W [Enterovibrio nigricans DSM 22720]
MKSLEEWFEEYEESHQNPINQRIHKVAVPGIFFSVAGLLWEVPSLSFSGTAIAPYFLVLAFVLLFYLLLSFKAFVVMAAFSAFCTMVLIELQSANFDILVISFALFVVLWILQFVGHHIEGKKPSFFKDIQFLLIGPAWVFHFYFPLTPHDKA